MISVTIISHESGVALFINLLKNLPWYRYCWMLLSQAACDWNRSACDRRWLHTGSIGFSVSAPSAVVIPPNAGTGQEPAIWACRPAITDQ